MLNISILGAGAIGGFLGARLLANKNCHVNFIARQRFIDDCQQHGISSINSDGTKSHYDNSRFNCFSDASGLASADVIFVCVKSKDSENAAQQIRLNAKPDAIIISLQNGIYNSDTISKIVYSEEQNQINKKAVIQGMVPYNVIWQDNSIFQQTTSGELVLSDFQSDSFSASQNKLLREMFTQAKIRFETHTNIKQVMWSKLVLNMNNSSNALAGRPLLECLNNRNYRKALAALMSECIEVLQHANIKAVNINGKPIKLIPKILRLPTPLFKLIASAMLKIDPSAQASMLDDLEKGRSTEVDYINGEIIKLAQSVGAQTPLNNKALTLIKQAEQNKQGSPKIALDELLGVLQS